MTRYFAPALALSSSVAIGAPSQKNAKVEESKPVATKLVSPRRGGWFRKHTVNLITKDGMVRARATLDRKTGVLSYQLQLETDSTTFGPIGSVAVDILDADGKVLAHVEPKRNKFGRGGKKPGKYETTTFKFQSQVAPAVAEKARSLGVHVAHLGRQTQLWSIDLGKVVELIGVVVGKG